MERSEHIFMASNLNHWKHDRNFDEIADHFEKKVYGNRKGLLRQMVIQRDLEKVFPQIFKCGCQNTKNIVDLGAGLGQFCISLAKSGHKVTYNDISQEMMKKAQIAARDSKVESLIEWKNQPCQQLSNTIAHCDIILCHALLEWLDRPLDMLETLTSSMKPGALLSLCIYNPAGKIMRNLICGNFKSLNTNNASPPKGRSLTPISSPDLWQIERQLDKNNFALICKSGIRVFSDYVLEKRGGNLFEDEIIAMELKYSQNKSLAGAARYVHYLYRKTEV